MNEIRILMCSYSWVEMYNFLLEGFQQIGLTENLDSFWNQISMILHGAKIWKMNNQIRLLPMESYLNGWCPTFFGSRVTFQLDEWK